MTIFDFDWEHENFRLLILVYCVEGPLIERVATDYLAQSRLKPFMTLIWPYHNHNNVLRLVETDISVCLSVVERRWQYTYSEDDYSIQSKKRCSAQ